MLRSYVPGVRLRKVYSPLSLDMNFCSNCCALLVRVSCAPTTAAPLVSLTVPLNVAFPIWAFAGNWSASTTRISSEEKIPQETFTFADISSTSAEVWPRQLKKGNETRAPSEYAQPCTAQIVRKSR